ncbi:MAG: GHKL domain-containing protein [Eubacterium sp.]|nr:GHKL domain-containing protein [Eubacterium sp.]
MKGSKIGNSIKHSANKIILVLIGFISLAISLLLYITRFIKNNYFPSAEITAESDYAETPDMRKMAENFVDNTLGIISGEIGLSSLDRNSKILTIGNCSFYNYYDEYGEPQDESYLIIDSQELYSVEDIQQLYGMTLEDMLRSTLTDNTYTSDNGKVHNRYEYYNYSFDEYIGESDYVRIKTDDYLELIEKYGFQGGQDVYDNYDYVLQYYMDGISENDTVIDDGECFLVMNSDSIYRIDNYGRLIITDNRVIYENEYLYIPTSYIYSAMGMYNEFEYALLFAPVFDSKLFTLYTALGEYYYTMSRYIYGLSSEYQEANEYVYLYKVGGINDIYYFDTTGNNLETEDPQDFEEMTGSILENYDTIISSHIFADTESEYSYYMDSDGLKHVTNFKVKEALEKYGITDDNIKFIIGIKTGVKDDGSMSTQVKNRKFYDFCKIFCPHYYLIFTATAILYFASMILLWFAVKRYKYDGGSGRLYMIDKTILEIPVVIWLLFVFISYKVVKPFFKDITITEAYEGSLTDFRKVVVLLLFTIVYFAGMSIYCSIIRRVKRRVLVDELASVRLVKWVSGMFEMASRQGRGGKVAFIRGSMVLVVNIAALIITQIFSINPAVVILIDIGFILINLLSLSKTVRNEEGVDRVLNTAKEIGGGNLDAQVDTEGISGSSLTLAQTINGMNYALNEAVEKNVRDEKMKAELVTNVSHDIKTPLTSIINYVGLIRREDVQNEKLKSYVDILESKSQRLKQLIEDLIEASRASSGEIELNVITLDFSELLNQVVGENIDRFENKGLEMISVISKKSVMINADGRHLFRITENVLNNAYKYSKENSKVYLALISDGKEAIMTLENTAVRPINESPEELMERFVRGDKSRSTEGSGLGLSIAKSLTELMKGKFTIEINGDSFKVTIRFPLAVEEKQEPEEESAENIEETHSESASKMPEKKSQKKL